MSDLIDRQAVIDLLKQMRKDGDMVPWEGKDVFARIRKLPTIQPEKAQLSSEDATSDTISRQAALDIFDDYNISVENGELEAYSRDRKRLCELPTAQPEPQEGHWIEGGIYRDVIECNCSECGQLMTTAATVRMNYCPNCGAKMKGAQNG